jgi:hypothetical protein
VGITAAPAWSQRLVSELDASDRRAEQLARGLGREQLNWRPHSGAWGVGQCLDHLLVSNNVYLPAMAVALDGQPESTAEQLTLGRFSRWFIRNYIAPSPNGTRAQAPKKIRPAVEVEPTVLDAFLLSNAIARDLVVRAGRYDVNRIRFQNPFIPVLRFTVGTGLEIISKHQSRHLLQGERVRQSPGFPDRPAAGIPGAVQPRR